MCRGGEGVGGVEKEKGGDLTDRGQHDGTESQREGERTPEHRVGGDSSREDDTLHTHTHENGEKSSVTPEYGRKNPYSDSTNLGWFPRSSLTSLASSSLALENASSPASKRKKATWPNVHW